MVTPRKPPWERRTERLLILMPASLMQRLREAAGKGGVSRFVREAIRLHLKRAGRSRRS